MYIPFNVISHPWVWRYSLHSSCHIQAIHWMNPLKFKVDSRNTRARKVNKFKANNKDTKTTSRSGAFNVNSEQVAHIVLVFPSLTLSK